MFKKVLLAAAFVGAFTFASVGTGSTASADVCYGGGYGGYGAYGGYGGPAFGYGASYRGFGAVPVRSPYYSRGFSRGFSRGGGFGYAPYGYRNRGVSFRIGF